uniref:Phospholipase D n=1 Tax=Anthurium amnicola TaxID=1678845 RepID=A0A1D1XJH3_9ARAE
MEDIPLESGYQSEEGVLLHGHLDIWIYEARCLPNMDVIAKQLHRCFAPCWDPFESIHREKEAAPAHRDRRDRRLKVTSDPYVTVLLAGATVARTRVIRNAEFPVWNQHFVVPVAHRVDFVKFTVKDNDFFGAETIGSVDIPASQVLSGEPIQGWFPVLDPSEKPPKRDSELMISLQYKPVELNPAYMHSIAGNPQKSGVEGTYFPLRKGGMVTLYQDAHVNDGDLCVPEIKLEHGKVFEHSKCWEDICHAILEAHHLVYIVGWSIYHEVRLVREPTKSLPEAGRLTLGELLKHKSQEGVRVCLLVWDDKTSHDKFFLQTAGVMQTHDEEARKFFKHSSVICVLSPRYASSKLSIFKQQVVGNLFTHHQKCVLVDTQASQNNRKITAFLGGLDLCDGRYDTPQHRLFHDLDTVFLNDFHNPTFASETKGPRQPWHDLHCKIEGPAAYDVLTNFEQRWRKATKWWEFGRRFKKERHHNEDALLKLERISWILSPSPTVPIDDPSLWVSKEDDPENWHVQIFRSIDSGSVKGFPKTVKEAEDKNLVCGKNLKVDKSIHTAYVKAIRSAKHFIYIENQYFLGSSYAWPSYKNPGADNLVPMELALKIADKIRARERFAVYIVIPMWPEGVPTAASVQEILFWQGQTIKMMYGIIAEELKSMNIENQHPQDYLNFYCLGNREPGETMKSDIQRSERSATVPSQKYRRFMIYVHAKGMVVDDEYVIVGSANINQRSLDGSRDTEIAMGAYQPYHTWTEEKRHPHGQVYGYRMSLWAEHLGLVNDSFKEPHMLECVRSVNEIAESNWGKFTSEEVTTLQGHILKYPIKVDADGKVEPIPGQEEFPDVGGKVLGSPTSLPDALTM